MGVCCRSQSDLVQSSEQSASKISGIVISTCEINLLGGWRLSRSKEAEGLELVNVELKYLLKDSAFFCG